MSKNVNEIKNLRKSLGYTQIEMAKAINVSRRTYQNYEYEQSYEEICLIMDKIREEVEKYTLLDETHGLLTIRQIKSITQKVFEKNGKVECAYLFGSYSRGEATIKSDVDILIIAPSLSLFGMAGLMSDLKEALHKKVDLIPLSSILDNEKMLSEILKKGEKLYVQVHAKRENRKDYRNG